MPTFYDRFAECAQRWPENIALEIQRRDGLESYTYGQTRHMAESLAQWLTENGFRRGDRCAILADNHPRWVMTYLGIIAAGCVAVPLDTALHADQIAKLLADSGTALLFCDLKHNELARTATSGLQPKLILMDATAANDTDAQPLAYLSGIFKTRAEDFAPVPVEANDLASLLYTSGTTADPKGVMLTHGNLLAEAEAVFSWADIGPNDAILGVLPLFHVLSQMANILLPLVKGTRVVHLETLNTTELVRALQERKISAFAVVPQFFYLIHERIFKEAAKHGRIAQSPLRLLMKINRQLRKLGINAGPLLFGKIHQTFGNHMRYLVTGGSRFDPQVGHDFYALGIDVLQAYGLTETTGGAFITRKNDNVIGSVGKPLKGVEGKILDPQPSDNGGLPVGEIAVRAPIVMKGYWNRPDATAATLQDGWLHTGDLGYFDASGNLFITGRKKDVIVLSNGKNVYPEEIEAHYLKSPYIKEICVMGLEARAGDPTSERLYAVVVPNFDVLKERKVVNAKEVIRFDIEGLSAQIASTKRVAAYEIWQDDLPRTTTRKIKRFEVEKRVRARKARSTAEPEISSQKPLTDEETGWLHHADVQQALEIIREQARNSPAEVRPGDNLELDLGFDSMQRVELLVALEQELGGDVEESKLGEIYTVRELVDLVRNSAARGETRSQPQFAGWNAVLQETVADPEVLALAKRKPIAERFWFVASRLLRLFFQIAFRLQVTGMENIPRSGPFLICSNHQSYLDPAALASILPWNIFRNSFAVGTSEIFGSGFMRQLARWIRVVVVDPDAHLVPAMRAGAFGLLRGKVLLLYPEGERSIDGSPKVFKKGAAILSIHTQAPIVPVAIEGFYKAWPRGKSFQRFAPLKIAFGKPIHPPAGSPVTENSYEEITSKLKTTVVEMWNGLRDEESNLVVERQAPNATGK